MKNALSHLAAWVICAMIALAIGELAGTIIFYRQQGKLVYFNTRITASSPFEQQDQRSAQQYSQRLHPYLGFSGPYNLTSTTWATNNLGFPQKTDLQVPFATGAKDLAVFVFGGSVASNLVVPPQGGTALREAVQRKLPGRNVIVYSMAQGSGKQPQQAIALTLLLAIGQHVDVVVNLDGFNDLALGYANHSQGVHPVFPSMSIMWGIANTLASDGKMTVDFYRTAADILEAKNQIARRSEGANNSRFGLKYLYHKAIISFYTRQRVRAEADYVSGIRSAPEDLDRAKHLLGIDMPIDPNADAMEIAFRIWLQSSDTMAAISGAAGAKYVHVLQPNQYFTEKKFSPEEAAIALSLPKSNLMRDGAERGYSLVKERAGLIASRGIISGLTIFDNETTSMYVDNCCHYTRAGEDLLANFVADQVVSATSSR